MTDTTEMPTNLKLANKLYTLISGDITALITVIGTTKEIGVDGQAEVLFLMTQHIFGAAVAAAQGKAGKPLDRLDEQTVREIAQRLAEELLSNGSTIKALFEQKRSTMQ